jgi:lipoteichoic acid synthase
MNKLEQAKEKFHKIWKYFRKYLTYERKEIHRTKKGKIRVAPYRSMGHLILFPLVFIYFEILLRLFTGTGIFQHLAYPVLFGLAAGFFCTCLTSMFPAKVNRLISVVLLLGVSVIFIVECLVRNTFQVYMTISSIKSGAGGVVTGFGSTLAGAILHGLFIIVIFLLPAIFYIVFGREKIPAWQYRPTFAPPLLLLALFFLMVGSITAAHGATRAAYTDHYEFSNAIETFGLLTGLRLDTQNGGKTAELVIQEQEEAEAEAEAEAAAEEESLKHIGNNVMDVDFEQLIDQETDSTLKNMSQYVKSLTPSNKNEYTSLFEGKNLILICAEAFSDVALTEELTPTLYRLSQNGITFTNYYQPTWGGSTVSGEYSFLLGLVPNNGVECMPDTIGKNLYFTMGNQLQRLNYFSRCYHNGDYDYYDRNLTHENLGYEQFIASGNGLEDLTGGWYPTDEETFVATLDTYIDQQPFSIYYMTLSGHCTYDATDERVLNNLETVKAAVGDGYEDKSYYYLCYQYELEKAVKAMVDKLEEAGIADDTVICLTADHYPYGLSESVTFGNDQDYVSDLYGYPVENDFDRDHNSLIIWSGSLENEDKDMSCVISEPTYSLDILPTLSNLFGLEYDSRLMIGRDVFSDQEALVLWNDYSWMTTKGRYDASTEKFTPADETETVEQSYIDRINSVVANKISFSSKVIEEDYYDVFMKAVRETTSEEESVTEDAAAAGVQADEQEEDGYTDAAYTEPEEESGSEEESQEETGLVEFETLDEDEEEEPWN